MTNMPIAVLSAMLVVPAAAGAAQDASPDPAHLRYVYATEEEALREIFPEAAVFVLQMQPIPEAVHAKLDERLGRYRPEEILVAYLAYGPDERFVGYGVVGNEVGKYRPITFMVGVEEDFTVREVQVLVYRESRGMEVHRRRFLAQYDGKDARDPLRINRDIINVTGATLSVRALNVGVKRALATLEALYGGRPPTLQEARTRLEDRVGRRP